MDFLSIVFRWIFQDARVLFVPPRDYNRRIPDKVKERHQTNISATGEDWVVPLRPTHWRQKPPALAQLDAYAPTRVPIELHFTRWLPDIVAVVVLVVGFKVNHSIRAVFVWFALSFVLLLALRVWDQWLVMCWYASPDYVIGGTKGSGLPGIVMRQGVLTSDYESLEASDIAEPKVTYPQPRWFWNYVLDVGHVSFSSKTKGGRRTWRYLRYPRQNANLVDQLSKKEEGDITRLADNGIAQANVTALKSYGTMTRHGVDHDTARGALVDIGFHVDDLDARDLWRHAELFAGSGHSSNPASGTDTAILPRIDTQADPDPEEPQIERPGEADDDTDEPPPGS